MRETVAMSKVLRELRPLWQQRGAKHYQFRFWLDRQTYFEGTMARITTEQQVSITVTPKTAAGRNAVIDGAVDFSSSDPAVATVEATGPLAGLVKAVGPGVAQILASFDADLGEGVRAVEFTGAIEVVPAEAVSAEIVFGTPETQPLPPA